MNYEEFKKGLSGKTMEKAVQHLDRIYECSELGEHEMRILYLAWLWKNEEVYCSEGGYEINNENEKGIDIMDYELSFEVEESEAGGVNLGITYDFYEFVGLMGVL